MEGHSEEEVSVPGGHEPVLQTYRPDDGEAVAVEERPLPLGVNLIDGIEIGE